MIWLIYLLVFCTMVLWGAIIFSSIFKSRSLMDERLEEIHKMSDIEDDDILRRPFSERVVDPFIRNVGNTIGSLAPVEIKHSIERKIVLAGNPRKITFNSFLLVQVLLGIGFPVIVLLLLSLSGSTANLLLLLIVLGIFGFFIPVVLLNSKANKRQKIIQRSLPDMLDLLLVSVEAGLGFDMALKRVVEKKPGELSKEFSRALEEIRVGKARSEALRGVVERTGVADIRMFIGAIIQAEQLGSSLSRTLSIQSDTMRMKRRQRAEEMAMKVPIKMIFPILFFIFPALMVVVLGPSMLNLFRFFASGAGGAF